MLRLVRIAAICAASFGIALSATAVESLTVPFSDNPEQGLGFVKGGEESPHWGPSSICISGETVWIADPVHQRMVAYKAGKQATSVALPFSPSHIWCGAEGAVWAIDGAWERGVQWKDNQLSIPYPLPARSAGLTTGPGQVPWVILSDGHGAPLMGRAGRKRAIPMGEARDGHGIGRKTGSNTGEFLLWAWDEAAEVKGKGPSRVLAFETAGTLGSIRPLGSDARGNVFIHLEILGDEIPVTVANRIVRIDRRGKRSLIQWKASGEFAPFEGVVLERDGTLVRYGIQGDGLRVVPIPEAEWQEVK